MKISRHNYNAKVPNLVQMYRCGCVGTEEVDPDWPLVTARMSRPKSRERGHLIVHKVSVAATRKCSPSRGRAVLL